MKINLYLSTAVAGLMMFGGEACGQCVSSQDCASLGYTKSSCPDGNGVKCPFGNKWFCVDQCGIGFKYTCTGTGYGRLVLSVLVNIRKSVMGVMRPAELIPAVAVIMQNAVVPLGMNGIQRAKAVR